MAVLFYRGGVELSVSTLVTQKELDTRARCCLIAGREMATQGDLDHAAEEYRRGLGFAISKYVRGLLQNQLALVYWLQGELSNAEQQAIFAKGNLATRIGSVELRLASAILEGLAEESKWPRRLSQKNRFQRRACYLILGGFVHPPLRPREDS